MPDKYQLVKLVPTMKVCLSQQQGQKNLLSRIFGVKGQAVA